jgi:hypothetical protein
MAFSIFIHIRLINNASDDAYIHIRIAKNLTLHGQPYFNLNDPVFSSSSIAWTILLGILFTIFPGDPLTVAVINGIFYVIGGILLVWSFLLVTEQKYPSWIYLVFFIFVQCLTFIPSIELMETSFAIMMFSLSILLFIKKHPFTLVILGMLPFIRMELAIFSFTMVLIILFQKRWSYFHIILLLLVGSLPFVIFELAFFHTLVPNTILAKSVIYEITPWHKAIDILSSLVCVPIKNLLFILISLSFVLFCFFLMTLFIIYEIHRGNVSSVERKTGSLVVFACLFNSIAIICLYLVTKNLLFEWYVPLYSVSLLYAVSYFLINKKNPILFVFLLFMIGIPLINWAQYIEQGILSPTPPTLSAKAARVSTYLRIGKWLDENYPDATLMTSEIGGLGYAYHGKIIDGAGLISPGAIKYHPMKVPEERANTALGAIPYRFILETNPDILVSYDLFMKQFLESDNSQNYIRVIQPALNPPDMQRFGGVFQCTNINIFIRKDIYH